MKEDIIISKTSGNVSYIVHTDTNDPVTDILVCVSQAQNKLEI